MRNLLIVAILSFCCGAFGAEVLISWTGRAPVMAAGRFAAGMRAPARPARPRLPRAKRRSPAVAPAFYTRRDRTDRFDELILAYALRNRLDPCLVKSIIAVESEFTPQGVSPVGALGLMQLMPATAEEMGVPRQRLHEPEDNIRAGTAYLNLLFRAAWKIQGLPGSDFRHAPPGLRAQVIAAYHAGPRMLDGAAWPLKTRDYVTKVQAVLGSSLSELRPGRAAAALAAE